VRTATFNYIDLPLVLCTLAAMGVGVLMIFSATQDATTASGFNEFVARQAVYGLIGIVLMLGIAWLDYRVLESFTIPFYVVTVGLLGLVDLLGMISYGSQRWINLGVIPIQPSELAKLSLILVLAKVLSAHENELHRVKWFLASAILLGIPAAIVYKQPDLGTTIMLVMIFIGMLVGAAVPFRMFLISGILALPSLWVAWNFLLHDYQRQRLTIFLNPESDLLGEGYNIWQTRLAIGSGGLFGQGYLAGTQSKLQFLKVGYSDFIISVVAEQFGFIGTIFLIALLFLLVWRCIVVASKAPDMYGSMIAIGVATWIGTQIFINVGMNIGLMPVTGIPLPFISYGGSSLMSILLGIGLVQSVAVRSSPVIFGGAPLREGWARSARTTLRPR
jgi:rod shape determining protein RodA